MEPMPFKYMGSIGDGRNTYMLLIEPSDAQPMNYRLNAASKVEAIKMAESLLSCKFKVEEITKGKKWRLLYEYGATYPALVSTIQLTKANY